MYSINEKKLATSGLYGQPGLHSHFQNGGLYISVVSDFKEYLQTVRLPFGISNTEGIYFVLNLLTYNHKDENYTGFWRILVL